MKQRLKLLGSWWIAIVAAAILAITQPQLIAEEVTATYVTGAEIPVTSESFIAQGKTISITLNFAPQPGAELTVVRNTGSNVLGQFDNLAQGQTITLSYAGINYHFVANYYGGNGNDLVLLWTTGDEVVSTAAKQKLDGQLLLALRKRRGEPPFDRATNLQPAIPVSEGDRVLVDIEATIPQNLVAQVKSLGAALPDDAISGTTLRVLIPLSQLEMLAARPEVKSVSVAKLSVISQWKVRPSGGSPNE